MRILQSIECQAISGGAAAEAIGAIVVGAGIIGIMDSLFNAPSYPVVWYEEPYSYYQFYEVSTPVYDTYGYYQGEIIDNYDGYYGYYPVIYV